MAIPKETVRRIMKQITELRVAGWAVDAMCAYLENKLKQKTTEADLLARHSKRHTIKRKDVEEAVKGG